MSLSFVESDARAVASAAQQSGNADLEKLAKVVVTLAQTVKEMKAKLDSIKGSR